LLAAIIMKKTQDCCLCPLFQRKSRPSRPD